MARHGIRGLQGEALSADSSLVDLFKSELLDKMEKENSV